MTTRVGEVVWWVTMFGELRCGVIVAVESDGLMVRAANGVVLVSAADVLGEGD